MRVLFMGTSDFAVATLKALSAEGFDVCGVITQPDKPKGRGYALLPPPVKEEALRLDLPVFQPETLKDGAIATLLESLSPDVIVVASYGKILPKYVLDFPRFGCVNVHASILPRFRGASPINQAILFGDTKTGVTTMLMAEGLDTGDILMVEETQITADDNAETLHDRLADIGGALAVKTLRALESGYVTPIPQPEDGVLYAPIITKEMRKIDFSDSAVNIVNKIRAFSPVPTAFCMANGKICKVYSARVGDPKAMGIPGRSPSGDLEIITGQGSVIFTEVALEGKKRMPREEFIKGNKITDFC